MLFLLENALSAPHLAVLPRRAVAQLGSALEWGSRGRGFESRRPDQLRKLLISSVLAMQSPQKIKQLVTLLVNFH
jgi:hypothetical protein